MSATYHIELSSDPDMPEWDAFLDTALGGHHMQMSAWARTKREVGWHAVRGVVRQAGTIVGGAQMLVRPVFPGVAIGYVPKGPVTTSDDSALIETVVQGILLPLSRAHAIRHLIIQPPNNGQAVACYLQQACFRLSQRRYAPSASVQLDLLQPLETIVQQMKRQTRQNVRRSQRDGISVRQGKTEADLLTFYRLHVASSQRQGFITYPEAYFMTMWRSFSAQGHARLFIADYDGDPVSALLVLAVGDLAESKALGWSGQHGNRRPNEAVFWAAIEWAQTAGYRLYDMGGIELSAAQQVCRGEALAENFKQTPTFFKLGFGGNVVIFPEAYDFLPNPVLRWGYQTLYPALEARFPLERTLNRINRRGTQ